MSKIIPLTRGFFATVDDADFDWLNQWKWFCTVNRYAARNISKLDKRRTIIYMHREIIGANVSQQTDHINHNKLDNRRSNLRICSNGQNQSNRLPLNDKRYSKYKGVTKDKRRENNWLAQVIHKGHANNLGTFDNEEDAARAYDRSALKLHGEFALTNERLGLLPPDDGSPLKRRLIRSDNTSGYSGIRFHKASGLWQARIWKDGNCIWVVYFKDIKEAATARKIEMSRIGILPNIKAEIL